MATYLSMDGVDDKLRTPPDILLDKIILDIVIEPNQTSSAPYFFDTRTTGGYYAYTQQSPSYIATQQDVTTKVNGSSDVTIQPGTRYSIEFSFPLLNADPTGVEMFTNYISQSIRFMKAKVYDVKLFREGSLIAHYNMSAGTVQDQSGNDNHAILTGGTWVNEGGGGTAKSYLYDTKQQVKANRSIVADSKQSLFSVKSNQHDTKHILYMNRSTTNDVKQIITKEVQTAVDTRIEQYKNAQNQYTTQQQISGIVTATYDTLQEIFIGEVVRSYDYDLSLSIYADKQHVFDMKQEHFSSVSEQADLQQAIYKAVQSDKDINVVIYADRVKQFNSLQGIYGVKTFNYDTLQTLFDGDKSIISRVTLQGGRELNIYLEASKELYVNLKGVVK